MSAGIMVVVDRNLWNAKTIDDSIGCFGEECSGGVGGECADSREVTLPFEMISKIQIVMVASLQIIFVSLIELRS